MTQTLVSAVTVGSAGKTTITRHVIAAHAPSPAVLSIESATPSGDEVELFERSDARTLLALKARLIAPDPSRTLIIDAGVTDSELVAQALRELSAIRPLSHVTVVVPVLTDRKGLIGLERFAPTLPASVRRVVVLSQVQDEKAHQDFRAGKLGSAVAAFCEAQSVELCPVPLYYSPLLDVHAPHHALLGKDGLRGVAALDIDALCSATLAKRGDMDAEARLGLAIDGVGLAQSALENTRAIYDYLSGGAARG
jgi:hypothetical protein